MKRCIFIASLFLAASLCLGMEENKKLDFASIEELKTFLSNLKITFDDSFKGYGDLFQEIKAGESELVIKEGHLLRKVSVVNVAITYQNDGVTKHLIEESQTYHSGEKKGKTRLRNQPFVAEKKLPSENLYQAFVRALQEELNFSNLTVDQFKSYQSGDISSETKT